MVAETRFLTALKGLKMSNSWCYYSITSLAMLVTYSNLQFYCCHRACSRKCNT